MVSRQTLSLNVPDVVTLGSLYMPMLERGGIFVPSRERYALGDEVQLLLTLPGASTEMALVGQVAWISPEGVGGRRVPGVGIHFSAADRAIRERIEERLVEYPDSGTSSHTL